jgi:hypothetical protein
MRLHFMVTVETDAQTRFLRDDPAILAEEIQGATELVLKWQTEGSIPKVTVQAAPSCFKPGGAK